MKIFEIIWDVTTNLVADTIALWSPRKANEYRRERDGYKRAYIAASSKGPYQLNKPTNQSGDAEVAAAASRVTAVVRDGERNNPTVAGIILKGATLVVGDEIGVKFQITDKNGIPNKTLNAELERRFYRWAETAEVGGGSLTEAAYLIENHLRTDGEIMIKDVVLPPEEVERKNPYRIQLLERDYLDSSKAIYGVEYSSYGKPIKFYLYDSHPGGVTAKGESISAQASGESKAVKADDICFLTETTRASQKRGISPLASVIKKLYGIDDLEDAELIAVRSSAAFGIIIKTNFPEGFDNPYTGTEGTTTSPTDSNGKKLHYLESGGIVKLAPGEDATSFRSERPNSNFDSFIRGRNQRVMSSQGLSYETGTGDFSQVNFSSARMADRIQWAITKRRQKKIIKLLNRSLRKWLKYEVLTVGVPGISPREYNENPEKFEAVTWQLAGNDGIDQLKEIEAAKEEIALGVNSRTRWTAERGRDFQEVAKEIAEEKATLKALGIWKEPVDPPQTAEEKATLKADEQKEHGNDKTV